MAEAPKRGSGERKAARPRKVGAKAQHDRFIETAKATGADETGQEFERAVSSILRPRRPSGVTGGSEETG